MPIASFDGLGRAFKFLLSKHTQTSIWYARPFSSSFWRQAYGII